MVILGFIVTCILLLGLFIYYKFSTATMSSSRVVTSDPNAQTLYTKSKTHDDDKDLSLKEKIEISWQFLYEITKIVFSKFTSGDRDEVKTVGRKLIDNGVRYAHSIDLNVKQSLNKAQNISIDQEKKVSQGRGI